MSAAPTPNRGKCIPTLVAEAFIAGWLPRRLARSLFYRSTNYTDCHRHSTVSSRIRFGERAFQLDLPLRFKQNWTILFENFDEPVDGPALRIFTELARKSRGVADIGMNAGLYLYHAAAAVARDVPVFGFEPNADLAEAVAKNLQANGLDNVRVIAEGCSDAVGVAEAFVTDTDHMTSLERDFLDASGRPVLGSFATKTTSLDAFVQAAGCVVDLIKIDVEGHEEKVMQGAWATIDAYSPAMLIEISDRHVGAAFVDQLFGRGYGCQYLVPEGRVPVGSSEEMRRLRRGGCVNYLFQRG